TTSGADKVFTLTGNQPREGQLQRSPDGSYVTLAGYNVAVGSEEPYDEKASSRPRAVARLDAEDNVDTSTSLNNAFSERSPRGAVTVDGTGYWLAGDGDKDSPKASVRYVEHGATASTAVVTPPTNAGMPVVI